ncbi:multipass membrane protein [Candidatus Mancarchaeum acidiphilum]|uniref:Multipass membrane protein n=1 Tax=Candidatus Mancarchaeum acidiphilum TaxID=1920749 RepID=A0A218NN62_9ARCH|nr:hypothetical protein [Candidatus Mancarchaeum acidiphilum]ASI13908.1 multipass membrane protein [Candidatus Mancarchaeum acidiphilum]
MFNHNKKAKNYNGLVFEAEKTPYPLYAAATLSAVLAVLFLSYFIIMNNALMILASLILFIALSFVIIAEDEYMNITLGLAIAFIYASSAVYFNVPELVLVFLISVYTLIVIFAGSKIRLSAKIILFIAFVVPMLMSALGFNADENLTINVGIIGYYLLISLAIAVSIRFIFSKGKSRFPNKLSSYYKSLSGTPFYILAAIICLILLVLPIYPMQPSFNPSLLPYSTLTLNSSSKANFIYLYLNLSKFKHFEVYNASSIGFYTLSGKPIDANIAKSITNLSAVPAMLNISPSNTTIKVMFFVPKNESHTVQDLESTNRTTNAVSRISNASRFSYRNKTISYSIYQKVNYTKYEGIEKFQKYYTYDSICQSDYQNSYAFKVNGSHAFSLFQFSNSSSFDNALIKSKSDTYNGYNQSFRNYSTKQFYNVANATLPVSNCTDFAILTNSTLDVGTTVYYYRYDAAMENISTEFPSYWYVNKSFVSGRYSFLPASLNYLYNVYKTDTMNSTKSS